MTSVTPASGYTSPDGPSPRQGSGGGFFALLLTVLGVGLLAGGIGRAGFLPGPDLSLLDTPVALALVVGGMGALGIGATLAARSRSTGPGSLLLVLSTFLLMSSVVGMTSGLLSRGHWNMIADRFGFETAVGLEFILMTGVLPMAAAVLLGGAIGARKASQRSKDGAEPAGTSPVGTAQPGGPVTPGLTVTTVDSSLTGPSGPSVSAAIAALLGTAGALGGIVWTLTQGSAALQELTLARAPLEPLALMAPGVIVVGIAAYLVRWTRLHLWLSGAALLGVTAIASVMPTELSSVLAPVLGSASYPMTGLYLPSGLVLGLAAVLPGIALGSRMQARMATRPRADWAQGNSSEQRPSTEDRSGNPNFGPAAGGPTFGDSSNPYGPPRPDQRF